MKTKPITMIGLAAAAFMMASGFSAKPAEARAQCIFVATNGGTWAVATQGSARRMSTACRRAERRCNRKVNRAKRRGEFRRTGVPRCSKHSGRGVSF